MITEILFLILALIIIISAIKALNADELVHAVVYLAVVLGGVAGIYLTLSAEFLAAVQILVYVGAVVTLILFAVMLTTPAEPTEGFAEDRTPLTVLGIQSPQGMDVEALEEVPEDVSSVQEAEKAAGRGAGADDKAQPTVEGAVEPALMSTAEKEELAAEREAEADEVEEAPEESDEPAADDAPDGAEAAEPEPDEAPDEEDADVDDEDDSKEAA